MVYPGYEKMYTGDPGISKAYLKHIEAEKDYEEFDTLPWWRDGGIMTNWIIGHTDRFTACVSQASISNLISFNMSDIGPSFGSEQFGASPWTDAMHLWDQSPLKYADKVKTPTLFIHSLSDYRCPIDQGLQMYTALKLHGVDTRFFMIRGESHALFEIGRPSHRVRYTQEITRWFEEHKK